MTTKIFKLKNACELNHSPVVRRVSEHLESLGFGCEDLEDMLYELTELISNRLREELGTSTAIRLAALEFTATEEINQHSMVDQLMVLRGSMDSDEELRSALCVRLMIELPENLFTSKAVI